MNVEFPLEIKRTNSNGILIEAGDEDEETPSLGHFRSELVSRVTDWYIKLHFPKLLEAAIRLNVPQTVDFVLTSVEVFQETDWQPEKILWIVNNVPQYEVTVHPPRNVSACTGSYPHQ